MCLDVRTGRRVWHFQTVHHDIWDYDNPTQPILADITVDGQRVEAVVQLTKQAFAYVFDRVTGAPVWPIVERPVPQSDVPGEQTSPTQPIPTKPAAFDRQGITEDDLIDFTPELREEARRAIAGFRLGSLFSPPSIADNPDGTKGTLLLPGALGGANWEGGALDPASGTLYVGSWTNLSLHALSKDPRRSDMDWVGGAGGPVPRVRGLPLVKPPYSRITAIDLNRGEHVWMKPSGATPESIARNPALQAVEIPPTGAQSRPVLLVTSTALFTAEGSSGAPMLHVLDKVSGASLTDVTLPGPVSSVPMSYAVNGTQYIAFWVSNRQDGLPSTLMALALPPRQ